MRLYPAIDLKDGVCVRLKLGDMDQATVYNADPGAQARAFDRVLAQTSGPGLHHLPFDETRLDPAMMAGDGFHPGAPLYTLWAQDLAAAITAQGVPDDRETQA